MPRGCDHSVHVHLEVKKSVCMQGQPPRTGVRHFIVEYDADGIVLRIKERKEFDYGFTSGVYNAPYWKSGTHALGIGNTLPKRIIAAAEAKMAAENKAYDATP